MMLKWLVGLVLILMSGSAFSASNKGQLKLRKSDAPAQPRMEIPVDQLVRMEEDPHYFEWLAAQHQAELAREAAADEVRQAREAAAERQEKVRQDFVLQRETQVKNLDEVYEDYKRFIERKRARRQAHEKARAAFAEASAQRRMAQEASRQARWMKNSSQIERMPAAAPAIPVTPTSAPQSP